MVHHDTSESGPVRVLVADDHRTLADAIVLALDSKTDLECVGSARNARETLALVAAHHPQVVVMDLRLGADDGLETTSRLVETDPSIRVVVLTAYITPGLLLEAARAGAVALLPKDGSLDDLLAAIRTADHDRFFAHPDTVRSLARSAAEAPVPRAALTPRELEVLGLLARGSDARTTARALGISLQICRGYIKNILAKMHTHSQLEAVVSALRQGLVHLDV